MSSFLVKWTQKWTVKFFRRVIEGPIGQSFDHTLISYIFELEPFKDMGVLQLEGVAF